MSQSGAAASSSARYIALSGMNKDGELLLSEDETKIKTPSNKYAFISSRLFKFIVHTYDKLKKIVP